MMWMIKGKIKEEDPKFNSLDHRLNLFHLALVLWPYFVKSTKRQWNIHKLKSGYQNLSQARRHLKLLPMKNIHVHLHSTPLDNKLGKFVSSTIRSVETSIRKIQNTFEHNQYSCSSSFFLLWANCWTIKDTQLQNKTSNL